jgi:hypothetical protein
MEPIEGSETSAYIYQTPGNYPKENLLYRIFSFNYVLQFLCTHGTEHNTVQAVIRHPAAMQPEGGFWDSMRRLCTQIDIPYLQGRNLLSFQLMFFPPIVFHTIWNTPQFLTPTSFYANSCYVNSSQDHCLIMSVPSISVFIWPCLISTLNTYTKLLNIKIS